MSRPRKTIDPKRVIYLASIGHMMQEIAAPSLELEEDATKNLVHSEGHRVYLHAHAGWSKRKSRAYKLKDPAGYSDRVWDKCVFSQRGPSGMTIAHEQNSGMYLHY